MINIDPVFRGVDCLDGNRHKKPLQKSSYTQEEALANKKQQESKTDTDIIVKADGSRVLLVTTRVCGMQTTMSLEISKPTAMQNDISEEQEERTIGQMSKAFSAYEHGYLTGVGSEL